MKTKNLVLKIISAVMCACSIIPLFFNFISLRNGSTNVSYSFGDTAGSGDALLVIARILFITTIVVAMILLVGVILQFFINNDILNWVVVGASIMIMITATLSFVGTLLYCLSISKIGEYVWFPAIGGYILLAIGVIAPILYMMSTKKEENKQVTTENKWSSGNVIDYWKCFSLIDNIFFAHGILYDIQAD